MGLFGSAPEAPKPEIMPEFREAAGRAGGLSAWLLRNSYLGPYKGDWVADLNPGQEAAMDAIYDRGMAGSPLTKQAQGYASDVLSGKYLSGGNPYLEKAMAAARDDIGREVGGAFSTGGMAGSPMHQQYLTEAWSDATAPLLFQNYENERQNQQQMAGLSGELADADFAGLQRALGVSGQRQQQAQAEIDAQRERWDLEKSEGYRRLAAAMAPISGGMSPVMMGGSAGSKGIIPGFLQGAMGGAMMGGSTGSGWGAGAGAILGGLGGGASGGKG